MEDTGNNSRKKFLSSFSRRSLPKYDWLSRVPLPTRFQMFHKNLSIISSVIPMTGGKTNKQTDGETMHTETFLIE